MLSKPNVAELVNKVGNRYELSLAVAKRARQISKKRVEDGDSDITDPVDVASKEFEDEKVAISKEEKTTDEN